MTTPEQDPLTFAIIGAAIEVHRTLGPGFLELVYQEALAIELKTSGIPFNKEVLLPVYYKNQQLECQYRADFICFGEILVETKALKSLSGTEQAQMINYLKATGLRKGLVINFGSAKIETKRILHDQRSHSAVSLDS